MIVKFKVPKDPPCRVIKYGAEPCPGRRPFEVLEPGTAGELVAIPNPYGKASEAGHWLALVEELAAGNIVGHAAASWAADKCISKSVLSKVKAIDPAELSLERAAVECKQVLEARADVDAEAES